MKFLLSTITLAAFLSLKSVKADFLTGISVPSTLKPGQEFNVTFHHGGSSSNVEIYQAIFGLTSNPKGFQNSSTAIGSEPFATNSMEDVNFAGETIRYGANVTIKLPSKDYFDIYVSKDGNFPNPWLISSANIEQIGASGGVSLEVFHAQTTIDY